MTVLLRFELVDLRGAEEADVDAPGLRVIAGKTSGSGMTQVAVSGELAVADRSGSTVGACRWCRLVDQHDSVHA